MKVKLALDHQASFFVAMNWRLTDSPPETRSIATTVTTLLAKSVPRLSRREGFSCFAVARLLLLSEQTLS